MICAALQMTSFAFRRTILPSIHISSSFSSSSSSSFRYFCRRSITQAHQGAKQRASPSLLISGQTHSNHLYCLPGWKIPVRHDTNLAFQPTLIARHFSKSRSIKMSDQDYEAFLNKANKDYSNPSANPAPQKKDVFISATAHEALRAIGERWYTSDSDEPFTDVTFGWEGDALPDEAEFGELVGLEVSEKMPYEEWDVTGSYDDVTSAIQEAAGGSEPEVYRVEENYTRKWYFVVALDKANKKLVGLKALAIES
ncbi:hypothetical protein TWF506_003497 [Arthrobotrys conoides]|uniref:Uncharacterized protein n=1 Tax=Arthrobotrys conoides TaxID=74498 RepID=A0AAN8RQD2_9PEZI